MDWTLSFYVKLKQLVKISSILFVWSFLFVVGCSSNQEKSYPVSKEEHKWLHKLFTDLLLEDCGVFVLWGSKPMMLTEVIYITQEEYDEYVKTLSSEEKKARKPIKYDLDDNWNKWKEVQGRFPQKRYRLFSHPSKDDHRVHFIYLVDILKTAQVIQKHYGTFREFIGYDFDPFDVVQRIQDDQDSFWSSILYKSSPSRAVLSGLLFGYGEKNSWTFQWYARCHLNDDKRLEYFPNNSFSAIISAKNGRITFDGKPASLGHFPIPFFKSFAADGRDEVVEQYKKEREEIKKVLKKNDFVTIVLEKLCS